MINFDLNGYRYLINVIENSYNEIVNFREAVSLNNKNSSVSGFCCLRHDIDYCLESALKMAYLERDMGISASYFFLIDSNNYNVLSTRSSEIILEISRMGHEIALHFDIGMYPEHMIKNMINLHASILETIISQKICSISYHNPGKIGLSSLSKEDLCYGYFNAYSEKFNSIYYYTSDSLCHFKDINFLNKIEAKTMQNIHLLIHPIWWIIDENARDDKIIRLANNKKDFFMKEYQEVIQQYKELK